MLDAGMMLKHMPQQFTSDALPEMLRLNHQPRNHQLLRSLLSDCNCAQQFSVLRQQTVKCLS
ncbi:hypothetical protein D3C86_1963980 [compost metagenome]